MKGDTQIIKPRSSGDPIKQEQAANLRLQNHLKMGAIVLIITIALGMIINMEFGEIAFYIYLAVVLVLIILVVYNWARGNLSKNATQR